MNNNPIRIFDSSLNLITELDDYASAYFQRSWSGVGTFSIETNYNTVHAPDLQRGRIVLFGKDVRKAGIITEVNKEIGETGKGSMVVTASGVELKGILGWRIVPPPAGEEYYAQTAAAETVMKALVNLNGGPGTAVSNRKFSLLEIDADGAAGSMYVEKTRYSSTVLAELSTCSLATGMGFYIYLDLVNKKIKFATAAGVNRASTQSVNPRAIFSSDYDTLKNASLKDTDENYRNVATVAGQGEGVERLIRSVYSGSSEPSDLARREMYIDARDVPAIADLDSRGAQKLSAVSSTLMIDGSPLSYSPLVYGVDYDLGDIVTLSAYGESRDTRITSAKESWAPNSYAIDMTFDKEPPTIQTQVASAISSTKSALNSVGVTVPVPTTASITITDANRDVIVNTANAVIITISAGLPVGSRASIMRSVSSANTITVARSGSETIEGGATFVTHGSYVSATLNLSEVVLKKVSSTEWRFVGGEVSGSNSNGSWIKYGDGTMEAWGCFTAIGGGTSYTIIMPVYFYITGAYGTGTPFLGISKSQVPSVGTGGYLDMWQEGSANQLYYRSQYAQLTYWHVIGRWKA